LVELLYHYNRWCERHCPLRGLDAHTIKEAAEFLGESANTLRGARKLRAEYEREL
jgi:hypothetical protein